MSREPQRCRIFGHFWEFSDDAAGCFYALCRRCPANYIAPPPISPAAMPKQAQLMDCTCGNLGQIAEKHQARCPIGATWAIRNWRGPRPDGDTPSPELTEGHRT